MVDIYIQNATPHGHHLGINDRSGRVQRNTPTLRPMHMAFFPFFAEKGTLEEIKVDGNSFANIFGDKTLDENSPYFNHVSPFVKRAIQDGGTIIAKRIVPENARQLASLRVSLDYLETELDELARDPSGNFITEVNGEFRKTGRKVNGIQYKFVVTEVPTINVQIGSEQIPQWQFGKGAQTVGDQTDTTGATSKRVPLFDFSVASPGAWGNLSGLSIWAPTTNDISPINRVALSDTGAYPLRISVKTKDTPTGSAKISTSRRGSRELDFVVKPRAISKAGVHYHLGEWFIKVYNEFNADNINTPPTYGAFSRLHVYQSNIDAFLKLALEKEAAQQDELKGDFTGLDPAKDIEEKKYLFNFVSGHHSDGRPYQTYRRGNLGTDGTVLGESITVWAQGGVDGEMTDKVYADAVSAILDEFGDRNSHYMDDTRFSDSMFYDTGLPLDVKKKLGKYISTRHDRAVVASTHVAGEDYVIPVAEENARLTMINGFARQYPESTIFGTMTCRFFTAKGTMRLLSSVSSYDKRLPVTYELLGMFGKWNGASNGRQQTRYDITEGDNNYFRYGHDVSHSWTPYQVRNESWSSGGMWASRSQDGRYYFEAMRSIYADESSTLMTPRVVFVHMELNKIGADLRRRYSGKDWPEARFKQEMEDDFYRQISDGKFGNKVNIEFEVFFTEIDREKGYAWHGVAYVYADGIKTVNTFYSENFRSSDLPDSFAGIQA